MRFRKKVIGGLCSRSIKGWNRLREMADLYSRTSGVQMTDLDR